MLKVAGLEGFYGASQALFGMAFEINAGEVVTLMGRNGMGKTTTVHAIMGLLPGRRGIVEFEGRRVDRMPSFRIARLGLGRRRTWLRRGDGGRRRWGGRCDRSLASTHGQVERQQGDHHDR